MAFSPDGSLLAVGAIGVSDHPSLSVYQVGSWRRVDLPSATAVPSVAFSPDGKLLATAGLMAPIRVWDVASWQEVRNFGDTSWVHSANSVAFSPDGKLLASGAGDYMVKIWKVAAGPQP